MLQPNLTEEMSRQEVRDAKELCLRIHLGLNPCHDIYEACHVLHDEGREAFERMRGPRCEWAHEWKP